MTPYANQSFFIDEAFPNVPCLTLLSEQEKETKRDHIIYISCPR
jgi:hypothetical protein